jgi:hypothetical protein
MVGEKQNKLLEKPSKDDETKSASSQKSEHSQTPREDGQIISSQKASEGN